MICNMTPALFPDQNRADRAVISIVGEDVLAWLHNLVTCDVATLHEDQAAYGALLSPQGKIQADFFIFNSGHRVLLDCAAEHLAMLMQKLVLYRMRAKLMFAVETEIEVGVHLEQPTDVLCYADPRHSSMRWRSFASQGSYINVPGHRGYDTRRIQLGLADSVLDLGTDKIFPHEANFDQLGAVNFKKGCYVGQEVVSRMQHRGTARNRFLPLRFDGRLNDEKINSTDKIIGEISSRVEGHALALLRLDRLAEAAAPLLVEQTRVHVEKPNWIQYDVIVPEIAR